jgi:hypothetical protein
VSALQVQSPEFKWQSPPPPPKKMTCSEECSVCAQEDCVLLLLLDEMFCIVAPWLMMGSCLDKLVIIWKLCKLKMLLTHKRYQISHLSNVGWILNIGCSVFWWHSWLGVVASQDSVTHLSVDWAKIKTHN